MEKKYSDSKDPPLITPRNTTSRSQGGVQGSGYGQGQASPMSRGSSVNSGLFDNLHTAEDVLDSSQRDHDGTNSLGLSDSGMYEDSVYLPSQDSSR